MPRPDLLALSPDDLATLANRGLVKRALAEFEAGEPSCTLSENASGTVSVLWSDDIHCLLPSGAPLPESRCSCSATTLCRHLIRSVFAYQREHAPAAQTAPETDSALSEVSEVVAETSTDQQIIAAPSVALWNPGTISDEELAQLIAPRVLSGARKNWEEGQVIEVSCGDRPSAFFHSLGTNLRFLVPNDARYTHCDCAQAPPCAHVPLAVWAFRQLLDGSNSGLISSRVAPLEVPLALLDEIERALGDLAATGVARLARASVDGLSRLENRCRAHGLVWPAEIVAELVLQIEWHASHNARFEPRRVAELVAELLIRCDAIRADTQQVPPLFVRGGANDKITEVGAARLIGLGTRARPHRGAVELVTFLQDADSGAVVVVSRDFADPSDDISNTLRAGRASAAEPSPFWQLARTPLVQGIGLGALGSGQALIRGGKRTASGQFSFGRTPLSFNAQALAWEQLRAPLRIESFAALKERLATLPPRSLRPRRAGEDIHVCPIASVEWAHFAPAEQEVRALLRDHEGQAALLVHPYTARGGEGVDALLDSLQNDVSQLRFVSGQVHRTAGMSGASLRIAPLALVFESGSQRRMVQPWIDRFEPAKTSIMRAPVTRDSIAVTASDPVRDYPLQLLDAASEWLLVGFNHGDERATRSLQRLHTDGGVLGFSRLLEPLELLMQEMARKSAQRHWQAAAAVSALLNLTVLAHTALEEG